MTFAVDGGNTTPRASTKLQCFCTRADVATVSQRLDTNPASKDKHKRQAHDQWCSLAAQRCIAVLYTKVYSARSWQQASTPSPALYASVISLERPSAPALTQTARTPVVEGRCCRPAPLPTWRPLRRGPLQRSAAATDPPPCTHSQAPAHATVAGWCRSLQLMLPEQGACAGRRALRCQV